VLKMVKEAAGKVIVFFGLSDENIKRMAEHKPIRVRLSEFTTSKPDEVVIFSGPTEAAMTAELLEAGLIGPETAVHTPDQGAPWQLLDGFDARMDEELDRFLTENPEDGKEYLEHARQRWEQSFHAFDISPHDPAAIYVQMAAVQMLMTSVFQAEDLAKSGEEGPTHEDVLKIMHFVIHNGMMLALLKRGL
jgi:hypothetical protein